MYFSKVASTLSAAAYSLRRRSSRPFDFQIYRWYGDRHSVGWTALGDSLVLPRPSLQSILREYGSQGAGAMTLTVLLTPRPNDVFMVS